MGIKDGHFKIGNIDINDKTLERSMLPMFDKRVSRKKSYLNIYTSNEIYSIGGRNYYVRVYFYNEQIQKVRLSPTERFYLTGEWNIIQNKKYITELNKEFKTKYGTPVTENGINKWKFFWGEMSFVADDTVNKVPYLYLVFRKC